MIGIFLRPHPATLLGPLSVSPDVKCSGRRYVKANPADRLAGRSHFSQNYTTDTYRYRASSVGGDSSSLVVDALANATSTRHPSRGWVNTVSAWGAIRNLVIGDAQDAQRRMLIINIKMIELY